MKDLGLLTIVPAPGKPGVKLWNETRFLFADGSELKHVTRCVLTIARDETRTATIDIAVDQIDNIEAHPMLSYDAVRQAALHYGFDLLPLPRFLLTEDQRNAHDAVLASKGIA